MATWSPLLFTVIVLSHLMGDFILQSRKMASLKVTDSLYLVLHGLILLPFLVLVGVVAGLTWPSFVMYGLIAASLHCAQDTLLWRLYRRLKDPSVEWQNSPGFWKMVGNDQALHLITYVLVLLAF